MQPSLKFTKVLPKPLLESIEHIFSKGIKGCALVGGTAIAGFYAGHRRSDDIDIFCSSPISQQATVKAVQDLTKLGAKLKIIESTPEFFNAHCELKNHHFTIQIVVDQNLFKVGLFIELENQVRVADFETLFKMKAATLVSRCGEKDLYDLKWLIANSKISTIGDLMQLGQEIDNGVNLQSLYYSIGGTKLRQEACSFSLSPKKTSNEIHKEVKQLQSELLGQIEKLMKNEPLPPLGKIFKILK